MSGAAPSGSQPGRPRVLIVEDEASIRRGLTDVFRYRGCDVQPAVDGADGLRRGLAETWDLIVLDIMLPELSGFAVCERLREAGREVPILMLTAKGDEDDIVRGFEVGADDYVTKPFGVRELAARADALLRRSARALPSRFAFGPLQVLPERAEAHLPDASTTVIPLSAREIRILQLLADEPGRIVSRRTLLQDVWEMNNPQQLETRTVDVHIAKLRKKLGDHARLIATVRGQGYRLVV